MPTRRIACHKLAHFSEYWPNFPAKGSLSMEVLMVPSQPLVGNPADNRFGPTERLATRLLNRSDSGYFNLEVRKARRTTALLCSVSRAE